MVGLIKITKDRIDKNIYHLYTQDWYICSLFFDVLEVLLGEVYPDVRRILRKKDKATVETTFKAKES